MRHGYRVLAFGVVAGLAVACASGNKSTTGPGGSGGTAASIVKVSGDSQSAPFGAALPKPLVVKVTDSAGNAVNSSSVAWLITLDGTAQTQQITTTNSAGETQIAPTMGGTPGGRLGIGDSSTAYVTVPTAVVGGHVFKQIVTGSIRACGLTTAGAVYCWGTSVNGNGTSTNEYSPTAITQSGLTFSQITMAGVHACGLTTTGAAYCWGDSNSGDLGGPGTGLTPVAVSGATRSAPSSPAA